MTRLTQRYWLVAALFAALSAMAQPASAQARGGMAWSGDVDGTTIDSVYGGDVGMDTVHGKDASNFNEQVFGYLPRAKSSCACVAVRGAGGYESCCTRTRTTILRRGFASPGWSA